MNSWMHRCRAQWSKFTFKSQPCSANCSCTIAIGNAVSNVYAEAFGQVYERFLRMLGLTKTGYGQLTIQAGPSEAHGSKSRESRVRRENQSRLSLFSYSLPAISSKSRGRLPPAELVPVGSASNKLPGLLVCKNMGNPLRYLFNSFARSDGLAHLARIVLAN